MASSVWYRSGTISIPANSKIVTGTNTKWNDSKQGIGPGQMLLIPGKGAVQLYEISSVDSDTQLTLNDALVGSAISASVYAVPVGLIGVKDTLVLQTVARLSYYQTQMDGWQQIMTGTGSVTLTAPDGTSVTISSFKKLTDDMAGKAGLVSGAVPVNQGGSGAKTAADARLNFGLGTAATRAVSEGLGYPNDVVLGRGAFGLGGVTAPNGVNDGRYNEFSGFYAGPGAAGINYFDAYAPMLVMSRYQSVLGMLQISPGTGRMGIRGRSGDTFTNWLEVYTTGNTTKASDGSLKAASPVARVVNDQTSTERLDVDEAGFEWCGCGTRNAEAEGVTLSRLDTGVYVLTGSAGLAKEGWRILPPRDPDGSGDLGIVEADETDSGGITIRLFKRKYMLSDEGEIELTKGVAIDVPVNSWIDVRLNMPENSVWNSQQKVAQELAEKAVQQDLPQADS